MPDAERHAGPGRRLVEDDRDRTRPAERLVNEAIALHVVGQVEHFALLARGEVVVADEVPEAHC
jgi:hypothetical protein